MTRIMQPLVAFVTVVGFVATLWTGFRLAPWDATQRKTTSGQSDNVWSQVNPIGVNTFLAREVETWKRERTLKMISEMGAGWIKEHFAWRDIEPRNNVYWDAKYQQDSWTKYDEIVSLAESYGLRIVARIDQTPGWAIASGSDPTTPPTDPETFGDFIAAFVSHFSGRIKFIQIWNEPNLAAEWGGNIDPEGYAELLKVAATRAREVDPQIVILSAPMAMTTEKSDRAMDELNYWQALYDAGAEPFFDVISANAYGLNQRYDAEPDPRSLNVRRVELLRALVDANGDSEKAIWLNEFGWNAAPADLPDNQLIWSRVNESDQAEWTANGIDYMYTNWKWFGVANIWYFRQVEETSPVSSDYYFRMVDFEFTPRDVYRRVQELGRSLHIARVGRYTALEAPIVSTGTWNISQNAEGDEVLNSVDSHSKILVRFAGTSLDLYCGPGTTATKLLVHVNEGELARDDGSSNVVEISPGAPRVRVAETDNMVRQSVYTAVIEIADSGTLQLNAIEVDYDPSIRYLGIAMIGFIAGASLHFGLRRLK